MVEYSCTEVLDSQGNQKLFAEYFATHNLEIRTRIISGNVRLATYYVYNRFKDYSPEDVEDLCQIGVVGLIRAVDTFRDDRHVPFASYATKCIENSIFMYLRKKKKWYREVPMFSTAIAIDEDGQALEIVDTIPSNMDVEAEYISSIERELAGELLDKAITVHSTKIKLGKSKEQMIREHYSSNITQKELGKKYNMSQSYASRLIKAFEKTLATVADRYDVV